MTPRSLPLDGIKVLDLTQVMAGPFCTMLLADMGADVVKVEKPGGDDVRGIGPPFINGESAAFLQINRNKRSIVMDLKNEQGVDALRRMAAQADALVQNYRPGAMERMGLGYEQVHEINPALVYCSISGFGSTGPYSKRAGFDLVTQGMSGLMSLTGQPGGAPTKVGVPITDLNAGFYAAYGVLCAYIERLKTGSGQMVDASLLEGGLAYTVWESAIYFATGQAAKPAGSAHRLTAPYQSFPTRDGYINIGAANQSNWERLCGALERPDLLEDPRFATNTDRIQNLRQLEATLTETLRGKESAEWLDAMERAGVPSGPIYDLAEAYDDPHVRARDMVVEVEHPVAGPIQNIGVPVKLSETPGSVRRPAPTLGQHTDEVLAEFGFSSDETEALRRSGAVA
ncbi:MAG: CoA transferase [Chloroflexi bacterium]|nr:CoA transferase [Chloroflexota bacterium]